MPRELAELGMALARAAAARALANRDPLQEGETAPAGAAGAGHAAGKQPDHALAFARLSRTVGQTIALEARIAAGAIGAARPRPGGRFADPRLKLVRGALHEAADASSGHRASGELHREIDERLEEWPANDPDGDLPVDELQVDELPVDELIAAICDDLGIRLDPAPRLPDAVLAMLLPGGEGRIPNPPDRARPIPPHPILPHPILPHPILPHSIRAHSMQPGATQPHTIPPGTIPRNPGGPDPP